MTRREELQKQYAEYERKLDAVRDSMPDCTVHLKSDGSFPVEMEYFAGFDRLEITDHGGTIPRTLALNGDQAEKLYHFLGGLYGE
jgi:hypothetical protein